METNDLSEEPKHQQQLTKMSDELNTWMKSVVRSYNGEDYKKN